MRAFAVQWRREAAAFFAAPLAYGVMAYFLFMMGGSFWMLLHVLSRGAGSATVLSELFGSIFFWLAALIVAPLITMRLVAEERRTGTLETLMTAPVRDRDIVLAKYAAALTLWAALWFPTLFYVYVLRTFASQAPVFDAGTIACGYLGAMLVGALFLAVGLLTSILARNQIAAAMAAFSILTAFFLSGFMHFILHDDRLRRPLYYASPVAHMMDFSRGALDSRAVAFYLINTWLVLWLCVRAFEARKGS